MSYPQRIEDCRKGPSQGGLPMTELKKLAKEMGIDVKGLKKADICKKIENLLGKPMKALIPKIAPAPVVLKKVSKMPQVVQKKQNKVKDIREELINMAALYVDGTILERGRMLHDKSPFGSRDEWFNADGEINGKKEWKGINEFNKEKLRTLPEDDIVFINKLYSWISNKKIKIMDEESAYPMTAKRMAFDLDGNLIFSSPR